MKVIPVRKNSFNTPLQVVKTKRRLLFKLNITYLSFGNTQLAKCQSLDTSRNYQQRTVSQVNQTLKKYIFKLQQKAEKKYCNKTYPYY